MRRYCILVMALLVWSLQPLRADETSKRIIDKLVEKIESYGAYRVDFSSSLEGEFEDVEGSMIVSGERYFITVGESELYYNGEVRESYQPANEELVLERPDPNANSVLDNPARFFRLSDADFSHRFLGRKSLSGRTVEQVELTPKRADSGYTAIVLSVDPSTALPLHLSYQIDSQSPSVEISLEHITPRMEVSDHTFRFDREAHPSVEVIDFR